jgi:hypothetical protein
MRSLSSFDWTVVIARTLAILWSLFWVWFGIASAIFEQLDTAGRILHLAVPGLFFVVLTLIVWRWEAVGGGLLLLAGAAICVAYPLLFGPRFAWTVVALVLLTMALPPLLAGAMFLVHWWRHGHHHGTAHPA